MCGIIASQPLASCRVPDFHQNAERHRPSACSGGFAIVGIINRQVAASFRPLNNGSLPAIDTTRFCISVIGGYGERIIKPWRLANSISGGKLLPRARRLQHGG